MNESDSKRPCRLHWRDVPRRARAYMINPINTSIPRTNDALSKQQRQDQRRKRKKTRDESEDSHDTPLNEEEEHLDLFA